MCINGNIFLHRHTILCRDIGLYLTETIKLNVILFYSDGEDLYFEELLSELKRTKNICGVILLNLQVKMYDPLHWISSLPINPEMIELVPVLCNQHKQYGGK